MSGSRSIKIVLGTVAALSVGLGVLAFRNYSHAETKLRAEFVEAQRIGATATPEQCVDATVRWYDQCDAMQTLCDMSVSRYMQGCLRAADRTAFCAKLPPETRATTYGFHECEARGITRKTRARWKACGLTYRTIVNECTATARK